MAAAEEQRSESSMSTLIEISETYLVHSFQIPVRSHHRSSANVDIMPIRFNLLKVYAHFNPETRIFRSTGESIPVCKKLLKLRFSKKKASRNQKTTSKRLARFKRLIARSPIEANKLRNKFGRFLSRTMGIDEDQHPHIIEEIMKGLKDVVPHESMGVTILHRIRRISAEILHAERLYYRRKLIAAAESFIQGLEEVKSPPLDDDGGVLECPICMEEFEQKKNSSSIKKLPCSHFFHRDCIVPWLQINHTCPTCRHPY